MPRIARLPPWLAIAAAVVIPAGAFASEGYEFKTWRPVASADWGVAENPALGIRHAVILFDDTIVDDSAPTMDRTTVSEYRRVRVFDDEGIRAFRRARVRFFQGSRLLRLEGRILKPDGREIALGGEDLRDVPIPSFGKLHQSAKELTFRDVDGGDILEYRSTVQMPLIAPPDVQFRHRHYSLEESLEWWYPRRPSIPFDAPDSIRDELTFQPGWMVQNADPFLMQIRQLPDSAHAVELTVAFRNLPPVPDEPWAPPERISSIHFSGYLHFPRLTAKQPYWDRLARGYGAGTLAFLGNQSRLDAWMADIIARPRDLDQDLDACFGRLHRDVRNVDWNETSGFEGGVSYANVDEVLAVRRGSTDDVNSLLVAMLRRLGYAATVFWARDFTDGIFLPTCETAQQFTMSGVALRDPRSSDLRYCFPALPTASPSSLPWQICGCKAMLEDLRGAGAANTFPTLADIPMPRAAEDSVRLAVRLHLAPGGNASGRLNVTWNCPHDPFFLQEAADSLGIGVRACAELLRRRALWAGLPWSATDESCSIRGTSVSYACSLGVSGIVQEEGGELRCGLGALHPDDYRLAAGPRETMVDLHFPRRIVTEVALAVPDGFEVGQVGESRQISGPYGEFRSACTAEDRVVRLRRSLDLPTCLFPASLAESLRAFFDSVRQIDARSVRLVRR